MDNVSFYLPIAKVDREQRMVFGYASTPTRDLDGEVIELEAIKEALPDYMQWRNVREMHQPSAVGVTKEANVDDKGLYIGAKIVDDDAWKKVTENVYKGFSIGGDVTDRKGSTITGLKLIEISLVDRPANPDCRIDVVKAARADGDGCMDEPIVSSAIEHGVVLAPEEVGLFGRLLAKLAGRGAGAGAVSKASKELYGAAEYADPGYQKDGKKRYPIDTEEDIRAAWSYIHQEKNAGKYSAEQVASIKRRIIAAWKKKIDEKGPAEADKSADGHQSEPVDADDLPAAGDGFSRPAKAANGGADCDAGVLVAEVARRVFEEAGNSAGISAGVGKMAEADLSKRAASGPHHEHMTKTARHLDEAHKCCAAGMERVARAMRARKAAEADGEDLAEAHEHLAMAHHHHVLAMHHLGKAAGRHKGEPGEQMGDAEDGIYKPEGGLTPLGQRHLTEGNVSDYEPGKPYSGKHALGEGRGAAAALKVAHDELLKKAEEAAYLRGKVEALERMPASPKTRLFAVPRGSLPVSEAEEPSAVEKLFKGVNLDATAPAERQAAGAKLIGNMIANAATFARPVIGDPTFRGGAGR